MNVVELCCVFLLLICLFSCLLTHNLFLFLCFSQVYCVSLCRLTVQIMEGSIAPVAQLSFFCGSSLECCEKLLNVQNCCLCSSTEKLSTETVKWQIKNMHLKRAVIY